MTNETTRRRFIVHVLAAGCAAPGLARAATHVEETDDTAVALGYHHDAQHTDSKRFPNRAPTQHCANCAFFQGAPTDEWAGCAMFGRKQIAATGWCSAWAKKPG